MIGHIKQKMPSKYVDITSIIQVIGCVYNNPQLLDFTDKYTIIDEDFADEFHKIVFGLFITIIGLTIFLVACNVGYLNMGYFIGESISGGSFKYMLIILHLKIFQTFYPVDRNHRLFLQNKKVKNGFLKPQKIVQLIHLIIIIIE